MFNTQGTVDRPRQTTMQRQLQLEAACGSRAEWWSWCVGLNDVL